VRGTERFISFMEYVFAIENFAPPRVKLFFEKFRPYGRRPLVGNIAVATQGVVWEALVQRGA
jgi:hypothetical protein